MHNAEVEEEGVRNEHEHAVHLDSFNSKACQQRVKLEEEGVREEHSNTPFTLIYLIELINLMNQLIIAQVERHV